MNRLTIRRILVFVFFITLISSCGDDNPPKHNTSILTGRWNGYEFGSLAEGFFSGSLTAIASAYANGLSFYEDGTYAYRFNFDASGAWTQGPVAGTYVINDETIELTSSPGTPDEKIFVLEIIKLDADHLWIHDKFWSSHASGDDEPEIHLERAN